jgi:hypothetical protein
MNKFIAMMATVSAVALAGPAFAQQGYQQNGQPGYQQNNYPGANADANLSMRIDRLRDRLQAGVQNGSISRNEAVPLRQQLRQLSQLERQYAVNGISGQERGELQRRMRDLRQALRTADGGSYNRDREDQYGDDGGNGYAGGGYNANDGGRIDNNRDGWDDRDYNRNGRWDDDVNQGGYQQQYQQQQPARSGLGGIVDSLLGRGTTGLRVGQQAPGNLYGLQGGDADQYRDGNGSFFRTDGRQIYQIDARSQTVVRVFPMNR